MSEFVIGVVVGIITTLICMKMSFSLIQSQYCQDDDEEDDDDEDNWWRNGKKYNED